MVKKFTFIKQQDLKDCGPACLAMISSYYGFTMSISKIRNIAGTDLSGTNIRGLLEAGEKLGFEVKAVKATKIENLKEIPLPAIAHVVVNGGLLHYVVIHKIKDNKIYIADPEKGLITYLLEEFCQMWTGILVLMSPGQKFQKGKEPQGTFSRFLLLLKQQKKILVPLFFASIFFNLFGLLGAFYFKFLIDDIVTNQLLQTLHIVSIGIIILYIFKVLLSYFRTHLILYLSRRIDIQLMLGYYRHVVGLPMNFFETRKVGEIISRFMDASKIRDALSTITVTLMIDTLMVTLGAILLYIHSPILFGVTLLLIPFYIGIIFVFHKPYQLINREEMESNARLNSYLVESLNGIATVKSYNAEKEVFFQTESHFVNLLKNVFKRGMLSNLQGSIKMGLELIGGTVILWIGAIQVLKGNMTIGELITYNALLAYFLNPIENLIGIQPMMQSALVAGERLNEIFDLDAEKSEKEDNKVSPKQLSGRIECSNVTFRYGTRKNVLNNISFSIESGSQVAFVGESGSGKTTISKLLMHYYESQQGDIYYDDYHIKEINRTALRNQIAYVSQESFFFSASIYENLCFGLERSVTLEEVIQVCKQVCVHEFVGELPLRYETHLEENASNLSGGQRQRLAIARALLKKPDILILDEATSNLDSTTEKNITDMLKGLGLQGVTVIMIAHRLSTIQHASQIFVMEKGNIIERGSHEELLFHQGEYYRLWKNQTVHVDHIESQFNKMRGGQYE
ncbi:peptidase domain-containing ABC transporter [Bacillus paranthracis]|uniref:Peptidase domain-containing ABC transporter n=1 Tax=Bacillus paranthracis TaxID=2026186 RepID=A0A5M9GIG4_9BACI|nr:MULTISPECIES: peptidase domain-containing ABC transporter [Bacillus]EJP83161.1 ABC-type bacteriocin transporter [Bacillus cereus IS075]EJP96099.1 ABC-type bacteriocin transporter [Bacillus cereus AND1407]EOO82682.1 ABC-type bacteriocin transporter [Bacillus cereus IS845/00]EOO92212.1 ABC-type bacteriocin transporter [Bacillus cereus IS195]KMP43148.1 bacteriocin ABC transporter ATPase [Bacillus cereus]MBR0351013.1 peptidase domain-containing ABC transporter [Clostridia bacterium]MBR0473172